MDRPSVLRLVITIIALIFVIGINMAADDPFLGTWKINTAKSKLASVPKSDKATIQATDNGLKVVRDNIEANGKATHTENIYRFDGRGYADATDSELLTACNKIDVNSFLCIARKNGKEVYRLYDSISNDGKMGTIIFHNQSSNGQDALGIRVYDKQ